MDECFALRPNGSYIVPDSECGEREWDDSAGLRPAKWMDAAAEERREVREGDRLRLHSPYPLVVHTSSRRFVLSGQNAKGFLLAW